jgi:hypothetical protein
VGNDNWVRFERLRLRIPSSSERAHHAKSCMRVNRYIDGTMAFLHGPRKLARQTTRIVPL